MQIYGRGGCRPSTFESGLVLFGALLRNEQHVKCRYALGRADANVSEIIAFSSNRAAAGGIVSAPDDKALFHEPGEGLWSVLANLGSDELNQRGVSGLRPQRPTRLR